MGIAAHICHRFLPHSTKKKSKVFKYGLEGCVLGVSFEGVLGLMCPGELWSEKAVMWD